MAHPNEPDRVSWPIPLPDARYAYVPHILDLAGKLLLLRLHGSLSARLPADELAILIRALRVSIHSRHYLEA